MNQVFTFNEALEASKFYFDGDELAAKVWVNKYALKDSKGNIYEKTPADMHWRLAREIARIEKKYPNPISEEELFELFDHFKYIVPQGGPMAGIGNPYQISSLSNCFSYDTEIITNNGIKKIGDCVGTKQVLYSKNGTWVKSSINSYGKQKLYKMTLKRGKSEKIIYTTANHRWFVKNKGENIKECITLDLKAGDILANNYNKTFKSFKPSPIGILHGFYHGDGNKYSAERFAKSMYICKGKEDLLKYTTSFEHTYSETQGYRITGLPNYFKEYPSLKENVSYLYGWLAGYVASDGNVSQNSVTISSTHLEDMLYVRDLCAVLGIGYFGIKTQERVSNLTGKNGILYHIRIMRCHLSDEFFIREFHKANLRESAGQIHKWHVISVEETDRVEEVYCADVPEYHCFTLADGILTGNCFVIGQEGQPDSYGGIMKTDEEQVQLMKRRGGVGHDLSHLRPSKSSVSNAALTSTGVTSFMERYSNTTREVGQDGRRGALMLSLSVNHPDADKFIDAKMEEGKVTGANISVKIDDQFMEAVLEDEVYIQNFPIYSPTPSVTKEIKAKELWDKIIHNAWKSAEPGILFWDTIIRESVPDCYSEFGFKTVSTNPCGEIPLCPYDSCRLIALNLYSYVTNPFTDHAGFDIDLLEKHARLALRIMDDIIDLEIEKIDLIIEKVKSDPESEEVKHTELRLWEKIREKCLMGRRTGVGTTAEGDMLAALGYRYGTEAAIDFSENAHKIIALNVYKSSVNLARERGAFPVYDSVLEKDNPFINRLKEADPEFADALEKYGRRNIACLTIAPTGTVSLMTQTSSGIEPVFLPIYKRRRKVNPNDVECKVSFIDENGDSFEEFLVIHPKFKEWMKISGLELSQDVTQEEIDSLVKKSPYYKSTSNDIDWLQKVKMQGRIQKWVDHSISVTINLPKDVSEELVNELYIEAWRSGCKGCTVYRDGSRSGVLVSTNTKNEQKKKQENTKRPKKLRADVVRFKHNAQNWIAFVGILNNRPYEIFTGIADEDNGILLPKSIKNGEIEKYKDESGNKHYRFSFVNKAGIGGSIDNLENRFSPEFWNYAKLISATLRYEMPIHKVVSLIQSLEWNNESINNWRNGVVRALKRYIKDGTKAKGQKCPNCGQETLIFQEGCLICTSCGSSKCG